MHLPHTETCSTLKKRNNNNKNNINLINKKTITKNLHVQQTPNPLAHEPAEVPPLLVHSDLKEKTFQKLYLKEQVLS